MAFHHCLAGADGRRTGKHCLLAGGLNYGIDFKGGTLMTVKFAGPPDLTEDPLGHGAAPSKAKSASRTSAADGCQQRLRSARKLQEERLLNAEPRTPWTNVLTHDLRPAEQRQAGFQQHQRAESGGPSARSAGRRGRADDRPAVAGAGGGFDTVRDKQYSGLITDFNRTVLRAGHELLVL